MLNTPRSSVTVVRAGAAIETRAAARTPRPSPAVTVPRMSPCWAAAVPASSVIAARMPYVRNTRGFVMITGPRWWKGLGGGWFSLVIYLVARPLGTILRLRSALTFERKHKDPFDD